MHNLLSAIGAAPHLARPNLPQPASHYPAGVQLALLPFGEQALRHFMFLERPEGMDLQDAEGLAAVGRAEPLMNERDIVPRLQDFKTVGHLYRSIEAGFAQLAAKYGEPWLFAGPPRAQATQQHFSWPELVAVTDLAAAQRAIEEILEQGEGPRGDWKDAHFGQFVKILDEYQEMTQADPGFDPVRPVIAANVRPPERDVEVPLISDPLTARVTDLFNVGYEVLLQIFERFFAHTEETDAQLQVLADATIGLMLRVIKPLGDLITTLPVGGDRPGQTTGPSFELFYETDYLMPHRDAAWALLTERLDESAWLSDRATPGTVAPRLADSVLRPLADALARSPAGSGGQAGGPDGEAGQAGRPAAEGSPAAQARPGAGQDGATGAAPVVSELLWTAAQTTTRLLASLSTAGTAAPELAEATAALQDLACRLAPLPEQAGRLASFWELQNGLPAVIQAAQDGPYLATNVRRVVNHLGEPVPATPQLALCRCGGSSMKPFCDSTHARNGFSGAKDPDRVPDRRDTYPGQQLTILDNRGLCQHSGFCTDRLGTVFRTAQEPFVAPSGGRMDEIIRAVLDCPSGALSLAFEGREAREMVDRGGHREPAIEVTRDGPYRITGGITLTGPDGQQVERNTGASLEHCALCRCGHSQNKPFCSGMHWYVGFRDPVPAAGHEPTLFEWAGGLPALTRMARVLYEKHVPADPLLAPLFANMPPEQPRREARWLAEAFGGPAAGVTADDGLAAAHAGLALTEEQRARWVTLAGRAADEAGLPADPEFRSAFSGFLEWSSRAAAVASQPGAAQPADLPALRWGWGPAGPPGPAAATAAAADQGEEPVALPGPGEAVSFATHIKPLFRARDRQSMSFAFDLWSCDDVRAHAAAILDQVRGGSMPCDGAWSSDKVEAFKRWTDSGMLP